MKVIIFRQNTLCLGLQTVHNSEPSDIKKLLIATLKPATVVHLSLLYSVFPTYLVQNDSYKEYLQSVMPTIFCFDFTEMMKFIKL